MIRKLLFVAAAALLGTGAIAQSPPPPKLLVVISVDGLSSGLFAQYRPQFTGGLARLASGTVFPGASDAGAVGRPLGALMKGHWPASRDVAIAGGQQAAKRIGGAGADQQWYWSGARFKSDLAATREPRTVAKVNALIGAALAQPRPGLQPTAFCRSKAKPGGRQLARAAGDATALAASPELDGDTLALAAGLVDELRLGRGSDPDTLAVDLSATANVAQGYGADSEEMCLQVTELDREIGDFLAFLDSRGIDYAVAVAGRATGATQHAVPILFWRPGFRGATNTASASTADIAPTLGALVALPVSSGAGHCLEGIPASCAPR